MLILLKLICRFSSVPVKILFGFLGGTSQMTSVCLGELE